MPEAEASVSIFDRGFLYGDGVFETMRVYGGEIFRLHHHLQRLREGLKVLQIGPRITEEELRGMLLELLERNNVRDGMARVYVTRGLSGLTVKGQAPWEPSIVATARQRMFASVDLRAGISTIRLDENSKLAGIKSANRLIYEVAQHEARNAGLTDAVLLNKAGSAVELTTSNLFVVKNGNLYTPPLSDGPLPGITRDLVLTLATRLGIVTREVSFGIEMFLEADEVFATNSLMEVGPVFEVAGAKFREHRITTRLQNAYSEFVTEDLKKN